MARAAYRQRRRVRTAEEARGRLGKTTASVAELGLPVLERLKGFADEHGSTLVVSWSEDGDSYRWLKSWADRSGVAFADWVPRADSVRGVMPALSLDNPHSGGHHRGWANRVIAEEFARQLRSRRPE
jgi:hypothetical protein